MQGKEVLLRKGEWILGYWEKEIQEETCVQEKKKFKGGGHSGVFNLIYLEQYFLKFNARIMHLGILLKCRF